MENLTNTHTHKSRSFLEYVKANFIPQISFWPILHNLFLYPFGPSFCKPFDASAAVAALVRLLLRALQHGQMEIWTPIVEALKTGPAPMSPTAQTPQTSGWIPRAPCFLKMKASFHLMSSSHLEYQYDLLIHNFV